MNEQATVTEAVQMPQNTPQAESTAIESVKKQHGGKRPGAGRKPNLSKRLLRGFSRAAIAEAISTVDCGAVIIELLKSKRERTRIEALIFIRDMLVGRPAQNVQLAGTMAHVHWTPGCMDNLSDEEMQFLDAITKKLTAPVSETNQNAPQNQPESTVAIEAEVMEPEAGSK